MRADEFLALLWGSKPPGWVEVWQLRTKRSSYLESLHGANVIASEGAADVYTGVALSFRRLDAGQRAKANQRIALAGLWLDLDVNGGPDSKRGAAPSKADALIVAGALRAPTMIVDSGYGVHGWWLFDAPWRFGSVAEQQQAALAAAQWYALHRARAQARGWTIDHTHDLARLLRLPGTVNAKDRDRPRPVDVLAADGPRYERGELLELCSTAGSVTTDLAARRAGIAVALTARADACPPRAKLDALAENVPEFAAALAHAGHPSWSQSEWDLSLCSQAAAAGWADQEIADLIVWDRTRHGKAEKALRVGYLRSTIARARSRAVRDRASAELRAIAEGAAA